MSGQRSAEPLYRAVFAAQEALLRSTTQQELLEAACRIPVSEGGVQMAWVGLVEAGKVRPVASAGVGDDYLRDLVVTLGNLPTSRGPTAVAVTTGKPDVCPNIMTDERMAPWRAAALAHGFRASAAVPIRSGGVVIGALTVYASEPNTFGDEEVGILERLADSLGYGVAARRAAVALAAREARLAAIVEGTALGIVTSDPEGRIQSANPAACRTLGYTEEQLKRLQIRDITLPDDRAGIQRRTGRLWQRGSGGYTHERRYLRGDGKVIWGRVHVSLLAEEEPPVLLALFEDITAEREAQDELAASQERLHSVLAVSPAVVFAFDRNGVCTLAEGQFLSRYVGRDVQLVGRNLFEWYAALGAGDEAGNLRRVLAGEAIVSHSRLGALVFETRYQPVHGADGEIVGGMAVALDVSERQHAAEAVAASEARFRALVHNSSDIIAVLDRDATLRYASPAAERVLGPLPDRMIGRRVLEVIHPDDAPVARAAFERAVAQPGTDVIIEFRMRGVDSNYRFVEAVSTNRLDDPAVHGIVVNARDVTDRIRAERLLEEQAKILADIARGRPVESTLEATARLIRERIPGARAAVYAAGPEGLRLVVGGHFEDEHLTLLHAVAGGAPGPTRLALDTRRPASMRMDDRRLPAGVRKLAAAAGVKAVHAIPVVSSKTGELLGSVSVYFTEPDGAVRAATPVLDAAAALIGIALERQADADRLMHQAVHDPLTGLPNRMLFLDRLQQAIGRERRIGGPVAVMFIDLDRFKLINDTYGHGIGDELLIEVGRRITAGIRASDTVARLGGDEFVVLAEDLASDDEALLVAQRIIDEIRRPWRVVGTDLVVSASLGLATTEDASVEPELLLAHADAAMYRAKDRGRGRVELFDEDLAVRARARLELENALRHAVESEEFVLHYQPQVDLETGQVTGVEALLRWRPGNGTLVSPGEFIPLAEETGLIAPIGRFVLHTAARQGAAWAAAGLPLSVSVNLSARQLNQPDLVSDLDSALRESGLAPRLLTLEVTETVLMEEAEELVETLAKLRSIGVGVAIDDFGTGYSSLLYLKRLPVDVLKIDGVFVAGLGEDAEDDAIVTATIELAHTLGLRTVAEGVENAAQRDRLVELQCDQAQGYLFARPMPADRVTDWVRGYRSHST